MVIFLPAKPDRNEHWYDLSFARDLLDLTLYKPDRVSTQIRKDYVNYTLMLLHFEVQALRGNHHLFVPHEIFKKLHSMPSQLLNGVSVALF